MNSETNNEIDDSSETNHSCDNEVNVNNTTVNNTTVNNTTVNNTTVNNTAVLSSQSSIDKLTMELMMNKSHYKKYLINRDPQKYQEVQEHMCKVRKYSDQIESLFAELLTDSMKSNVAEKHTRAINDSFQEYIKTCIQHFEIKDLEQGTSAGGGESSASDMMFEPSTLVNSTSVLTSSSWGNPVIKKEQSKDSVKPTYYTMDMYMNKKP